jgi:7,8-dihydropterin-6-yl-methyl-4-(beta-D-ribofuranosyl)aminobenzene 5'-phosphate synthase
MKKPTIEGTKKRRNVIAVCIIAILIVFPLGCIEEELSPTTTAPSTTTVPSTTTAPSTVSPEEGTVTITVVYDNNPYREGLAIDWGFSCLIRGTEKTILFDTGGRGDLLLKNMTALGIDIEEVDLIVISHNHGDHTGGLLSFLSEQQREVTVYLPGSTVSSSITRTAETRGAIINEDVDPVEICAGVYSTGLMGGGVKEQGLIIQTEKGFIVITGCAHPGVVQMVEKAREIVSGDPLLVMGGFHLVSAPVSRVEQIVSDFRELGVRYVGPCHCSGDTARRLFEEEYGENFITVGVGKILTLEELA